MEMLQVFKYLIKRDRLNLTENWKLTDEDLEWENKIQDKIAGFEVESDDSGSEDGAWNDEDSI